MNDKIVKRLQVGLLVLFVIVFVAVAWMLREDAPKAADETKEQDVVVETLPTEDGTQNTEEQNMAQEPTVPIDWEYGILTGSWGDNETTQRLLSASNTFGNAQDYLTFLDEESGNAYVIAGVREGNGITGSLWRVAKWDVSDANVTLIKQYICLEEDSATYMVCNNCKYLVLNYWEEDALSGQILSFPTQDSMELLEGIPGKKSILADGQMECEGDRLYTFQCYSDGSVRATDGVAYTEEEYVWVDPQPLNSDDSNVYGMEVELTEEQQAIQDGVLLDCSQLWNAHPRDKEGQSTEYRKELHRRIYVIRQTKGFVLYGVGMTEEMLLETPDGKYVSMPGYFTSNYDVQPEVLEGDFDEDGAPELAIKILTMHGTGVCIDQLFMADKSSDGLWYVYEIPSDWYNEQLMSHVESKFSEEGLELLVDGESKGIYAEIENDPSAAYYAGSQIEFSFEEGDLQLIAELVIYSNSNFSGTGYYDALVMTLSYKGDGKWAEKSCEFRYNEDSRALEEALKKERIE